MKYTVILITPADEHPGYGTHTIPVDADSCESAVEAAIREEFDCTRKEMDAYDAFVFEGHHDPYVDNESCHDDEED